MFDLIKHSKKIKINDHHSVYQGLAEKRELFLPLVYSGLDGACVTG